MKRVKVQNRSVNIRTVVISEPRERLLLKLEVLMLEQ